MNVILHYAGEATESDHHGASRQSVATFAPYLGEPARSLLRDRFPTGHVFARGATVGKNNTNKTQWDKVAAGDLALFLRNNTVIGSGEVVFKVQSAELSRALGWKEKIDSGLPFELIYTVTNVTQLNLPRKGLLQAIGYSPKTDPQ